jgi:hypothetical protein
VFIHVKRIIRAEVANVADPRNGGFGGETSANGEKGIRRRRCQDGAERGLTKKLSTDRKQRPNPTDERVGDFDEAAKAVIA